MIISAFMRDKIWLIVAVVILTLVVAIGIIVPKIIARRGNTALDRSYTVLIVTNAPALDNAHFGFLDGMTMYGYEPGKNIRYIEIPSTPDIDSTKAKIQETMTEDVDLIYVMGILAARAAKSATIGPWANVPVVFGVVSNPVGTGLVASMQSSGNNFVGITPANDTVSAKRLEVLLRTVPSTRRVIFPWSDEHTSGVARLREAVDTYGIELVERQVANRDELLEFLTEFAFEPGDSLLRSSDSVTALALAEMNTLAIERKVPLVGTNSLDAERGALLSYGANYYKIGDQAARLAHTIFGGTRPTDLPIELPEEFELVINAKTAETIGITIPEESLLEANRVIRQ
jgi:putative ABC transport system substrate-binding protein